MGPSQLGSRSSRCDAEQTSQVQLDASLTSSSRRRSRTEESWVEVSSQASASSLASLADVNSRVPNDRIPRPLIPVRSVTEPTRSASTAGSSQDEYEESSSESDRVLSSSNEDLSHENAASDDDNRTALGTRPTEPFTPQPNAFSHPPSTRPAQDSYFPHITSAPNSHLHSRTPRTRPHLQRERERTGMASSYQHQHDHDAALRASLTTLLSCAAAVRPKSQQLSSSPGSAEKTKQPSNDPP